MQENYSILIVDDDKIDRESVRRYLRKAGRNIEFCEASSGEEAFGQLKKKSFDCVFLDYNLPDMDGISLLRKFYDSEKGIAPSPTVMLTGKGSESVMIDALRWGAQDYLVKDNISSDSLYIALTKAKEMYELKISQHQANEIRRQSQKMEAVGQLTSGVAHDFNNLLTIVLGNTRLMQKRLQSGEDISGLMEDFEKKVIAIETAAKKGAELVKRLMVFTRQRPVQMEVIDINGRVQEINELLKRTLGERISVKTIVSDGIWPVQVDVGQFENALINMAVNARDAMPDGGSLTLETQNVNVDDEYVFRHPDMSAGPYVMIAISDTGTGMPPEVAKRIFEPFYTTKKAGEGTGLGLSMVYGMLKQCGGYIHVYSEMGHGTVFRIYLPKVVDKEGSLPAGTTPQVPQGSETILVVDDDEKIRNVGAIMLERLGYRTLQAANGRTALEILKHEHKNISLLFTDVMMPDGMNGMQLMEKAREYFPQIKVLFTSGYTENTMPNYGIIAGQELIGKPYRKEDLAKKVRKILDSKEGQA
jgi:signal transduction histidine kinase